jgi:hypothetical protein
MRRPVYVILGIVVVVVVIGAWAIYARSSNGNSPVASPAVSSQPAAVALTPGPATISGVARCTSGDLALNVGSQNGAAGTLYSSLVLTNKSSQECALVGYPGVSLVDMNGKQIGQPASRDTSKPANPVIIEPGKTANATIGTHDPGAYGPGACSGLSQSVKVYPPGDTQALSATFEETYCGSWLVTPVADGSSGA